MTHEHRDLSVRRQCKLLSLARSSLYYHLRGQSAENLAFMEVIDRQFLETPWYGSRQMARHMQREGHACGRHRVRRLMRLMRLVPIRCPAGYCAAMPEREPGAQDQSKASGTQDLSVPPPGLGYHPPQSGLVYRHHLHSDAARVPLPGRHHGLVQPEGAELAAVELNGRRVLHRGLEGCAGHIRSAGGLQFRPRFTVHQHRFHRRAARRQGEDLDGGCRCRM